jgi:hypothetical protein
MESGLTTAPADRAHCRLEEIALCIEVEVAADGLVPTVVISAEGFVPAIEVGTERMPRAGRLRPPPPRRTTDGGSKPFYDESASHVGYERHDAHLLF